MLALLVGVAPVSADPPSDKKTPAVSADKSSEKRNKDVIAMAEEFGVIVGPVTEDIRKELNLRSAEGVAVFDIVGDSPAEKAGIKVHAVIAEINKKPVRNLDDFGRLLTEVLEEGNFTVGTWEPTSPENQGQGQQMNFHFVPKVTD
jgi:C-terminal processing protease CtpA/Prc